MLSVVICCVVVTTVVCDVSVGVRVCIIVFDVDQRGVVVWYVVVYDEVCVWSCRCCHC